MIIVLTVQCHHFFDLELVIKTVKKSINWRVNLVL